MNPALLENIKSRQGFWSDDRIDSLAPRKIEEIEFHNLDRKQSDDAAMRRDELDMHANRKWYLVTEKSRRYTDAWIKRHAKDKVFLDYACGSGQTTLIAAREGSSLAVGLDISDESIKIGRQAAQIEGLTERCRFVQGDCEATEFPDSSFDTVICSGMLHHLDLDAAYAELRRILKPGGRILCIEALAHNPLIQAYRNRTPVMRTEWEAQHILGVPDAWRAQKWFKLGEFKYWHLAELGSVPFRNSPAFRPLLALGSALDSVLLAIPGLQRMAWQFTFELKHPQDD